ncbi:MAG: threonine ammonia-lyase [Oscillospiraceae bacterium]
MLTLDKIYHAAFVLKEVARKTDMIAAPKLSTNANIFLKTENLQNTGSFKLRGAYYKISQLTDAEKSCGIVACSAGNHAQGVALSAQKNNIPCIICMPDGAPISKVENTKSYGAEVRLVPGAYDEAAAYAETLRKESGYTFIHPFDDDDVIAGQGTIGLEILEQLPDVDIVLVPVGGGGLISGVAFALKSLNPNCKVYGVQAAGAPSMAKSVKEKKQVTLKSVSTFADGIAVKHPGDNTFALVQKYVDGIVTVTDDEIATAILTLIEKQKMICEGAGAVSVAAAMFNKVDITGKNVCCLLSGGNIDVNILSRVIGRGLLTAGRTAELTIALADKPGQLTGVSEIISKNGGNVIGVFHDQAAAETAIASCRLKIKMETRDHAQVEQIRTALTDAGFELVD